MVSKRRKQTNIIMCSWSQNHIFLIFFFYSFLLYNSFLCYSAEDTITLKSLLSDEIKDSLVSAGEVFELGFFTPNGSYDSRRYIGIWYYKSNPHTVVWVANRDNPLSGTGGVFAISDDGNLKVMDKSGQTYWSTKIPSSTQMNRVVKLMDSGNLVLSNIDPEDNSMSVLWQSFENPTDTFLPGMMLSEDLVLTSWTSYGDPGSGNFTFQQDQEKTNQVIILKRSVKYWNSGVSGRFISLNEMPPAMLYLLSNFTSKTVRNDSIPYLTASLYKNTRLVMSVSGQIQYLRWDSQMISSPIWAEPRDKCSVYNACGNFGSCNSKNNLVCKCLPGFKPISPENWNTGDYSKGCVRRTTTCQNNSEIDTFLDLKMMKVGNPDSQFNAKTEEECKVECLNNCQCQAYLFEEAEMSHGSSACWIWSEELNNLQEEYATGRNLHVRVAVTDIELTARSCEVCGTNLIPYPLSIDPKCGDPLYYSFHCNNSNGQVSFETNSGTFRVTSINPNTQSFFIRLEDLDNCKDSFSEKFLKLNQSLPFTMRRGCNANLGNFSSDMISKHGVEVEIAWKQPLEPPCSSSVDCENWPNSACNTAQDGKNRCLCNKKFKWDNLNMKCRGNGYNKTIRRGKMNFALIIIIILITIAVVITLSSTIIYICCWRRKLVKRQGSRGSYDKNGVLQWYDSDRRAKSMNIDSGRYKEDDTNGIEVPFFDLESILTATSYFSNANKLGQGGFGPVYKGELAGGQEIAVKRLSSSSGQGHEEFKNEVLLIAKLQHRNLVRLLGYCIEGEERMLVYEYMANKSLDSFIFDRKLCMSLDWDMRFNIILGIARGLLYLHYDSRLRIIHRDLKTSNILLDQEMNPKISDFGLARIFGGDETAANTKRVVGTYGYMSPEYALDGLFSLKSDVFSFGVVVIEIISGKRNTGFFEPEQALSLLGYAWHLWKEEKALNLIEETVVESCKKEEYLKCFNLGLLCVQEDPSDRPTMSNVVFMLGSETATLPTPKQPAFVVRRCPSSKASSSSKPETYSHNELTVTLEYGR
ncbi:hypothetical protein CsatB_020795 [Cannabis sativa]